jgi:hypothetical protein
LMASIMANTCVSNIDAKTMPISSNAYSNAQLCVSLFNRPI